MRRVLREGTPGDEVGAPGRGPQNMRRVLRGGDPGR